MLTFIEAIGKASKYIKDIENHSRISLTLLIDDTIEFHYGWVFFYQSTKFIETGDIMNALGGNAPIIINKFNGSICVTGTGKPTEKHIDEYIKNQEL